MPSFDIIAFIKEIARFVRLYHPNISVVKYLVPANHRHPIVVFTNLSDRPVEILDAGFAHVSRDVSFCERVVQSIKPVVKFPQTINPGASLTVTIGPGAEDLWKTCDVYAVNFNGNRILYKAEPKFSTAR